MKRIKRVLAVMLVLVMSMALVAGCNKNKQTMFSIMRDAADMTKYSYDINAKLTSSISGLENLALTFKGETDGEAMTMGMKVSYSFITVDVDNFLTVTKDAMYVNIQTLFEKLAPILLGSSYSLEDFENEFGTELKCIKFPLVEGMVNFDGGSKELMDTYFSIFENAFKDVKIEENKGEFTAKVEGAEEFSKLADAFITGLLDNQDTIIAELEKSNVDNEMVKKFFDLYMDESVAALNKFNTEYEIGLTDEDIASLKDEALKAVDDALNEADLDDVSTAYKDTFDELRTNKDDFVNEIAGLDGTADLTITNSLTGKAGSRVYSCTSDVNAESADTDEDISLQVVSVMTENNDLSVKAPESFTELSDIIYAALVYAYENDLLDDVVGGAVDIPGLDTGLDSSDTDIEYNGSAKITDGYSTASAVLDYDDKLLEVDTEYSAADSGFMVFQAVGDPYCYTTIWYEADTTIDDLYDFVQNSIYSDTDYYKNLEFTEISSRELNSGVTLYEFDVTCNYGSESTFSHDRYFGVETGNGIIYGDLDVDYDLTESDTLPYEQFMNALFVGVHLD